ncbi:hypothetical protein ACQP0C_18170 [Nocardia sp. CA-129566]|uniref:hypothetical protein n=1 Tax=Nocardia sp. CA-129566 TaxID=3239976 RepID=UPI003D95A081
MNLDALNTSAASGLSQVSATMFTRWLFATIRAAITRARLDLSILSVVITAIIAGVDQ